jgi:hypothetical protein
MIIKFGKIELSDWQQHPDGWCRYKLGLLEDGGVYHERAVVQLMMWLFAPGSRVEVRHVRFYGELYQLDKLYNPNNIVLDWHLEFTKNSVDNFLIRMSKLRAFL